jgi:hypothetical protein
VPPLFVTLKGRQGHKQFVDEMRIVNLKRPFKMQTPLNPVKEVTLSIQLSLITPLVTFDRYIEQKLFPIYLKNSISYYNENVM